MRFAITRNKTIVMVIGRSPMYDYLTEIRYPSTNKFYHTFDYMLSKVILWE